MAQSTGSSAPPWSIDAARPILDASPDAMLPALQALQNAFGHVHPEAIDLVAEHLNVSTAEVYGVLTFYRDLRTEPAGQHRMSICRAEACQATGARQLWAHATERLGTDHGHTTADGSLTLTETFCLGNCALGPSVMFDDRVIGRVDTSTIDSLLADAIATSIDTPVADRARVIGSAPTTATRPTAAPATATQPSPSQASPGGGTRTVYVPGDSAARSVGADEVAAAIAHEAAERGLDITIVRNGTRGALWLEPLVEIEHGSTRIAYGPIEVTDVATLLDEWGGPTRGVASTVTHPKSHGEIAQHPWFTAQDRITLCRMGIIDPASPVDFERHGGMSGLRAALAMTPQAVIDVVKSSGLRGRGGAGFPTGIKWQTVLDAGDSEGVRGGDRSTLRSKKYVCANADEGDSGTFADRMLMEGDPFSVIEGIAIAAYAVGADEAFIYIRSEYPDAVARMRSAVDTAQRQGWLGQNIFGTDFHLDLHIRVGAGAYICGEETAMLESLEGKRGMVRPKPPLPALEGLFGRPTVVNNVLTLATTPALLAGHGERYATLGTGRSVGTQVFQLAGDIARGGAIEVPFGITLNDLVEGFGQGTRSGHPIGAVQVGGPLGAYLPTGEFGISMDYESLTAAGGLLGHGGVVVFDDSTDMGQQARFAMVFCAEEACGKCTPCRIGSTLGVELIDRMLAGNATRDDDLELLEDLCEVMASGSLCAMGGLTAVPVRSVMRHFPDHLSGERMAR
ncbi:MAG: NAD(P)H-dependent oxidoreductase subunit E [Acidimicrobiia bacterium]